MKGDFWIMTNDQLVHLHYQAIWLVKLLAISALSNAEHLEQSDWLCSESSVNRRVCVCCLLHIMTRCTPRAVSVSIPPTMQSCLVLAATLAGGVFALPAHNDTSFRILSRAFDTCSSDQDMFSCLKVGESDIFFRARNVVVFNGDISPG